MTWADEGVDMADALHLALAADHDALATFDHALQRRGRARAVPTVTP